MSQPNTLKLKTSRILLIGVAFMAISMFWQFYKSYMPLYLLDFGYDTVKIGLIMALDSILAFFILPLTGAISDKLPAKIKAKFGRRTPFIVIGSIISAILVVLLNIAHNMVSIWFMMPVLIGLLLSMCMYRSPAVSLMPDITPKRLRSGANAIVNIMGAAGMALALVLSFTKTTYKTGEFNQYGIEIIKLDPSNKNWIIVGAVAAVLLITALVFMFIVKENKFVHERDEMVNRLNLTEDKVVTQDNDEKIGVFKKIKNALGDLSKGERKSLLFILLSVALWYMAYNAINTWFSTYAFTVLGKTSFEIPMLIGNVAGFAMFVPASILGKKIGRKRTVLLGVGMLILAFGLGSILTIMVMRNPSDSVKAVFSNMMYPVFVLVGGGWATINVHSFVMSVEMANEKTNGIFTGIYYAFSMFAQAITPVLSGLVFKLTSTDGETPYMLLPYALVFMVLAFVTMLFVKHGDAKKELPAQELTEQQATE